MMDSNNFQDNVGVGEREGRIASDLVQKRYYRCCNIHYCPCPNSKLICFFKMQQSK